MVPKQPHSQKSSFTCSEIGKLVRPALVLYSVCQEGKWGLKMQLFLVFDENIRRQRSTLEESQTALSLSLPGGESTAVLSTMKPLGSSISRPASDHRKSRICLGTMERIRSSEAADSPRDNSKVSMRHQRLSTLFIPLGNTMRTNFYYIIIIFFKSETD